MQEFEYLHQKVQQLLKKYQELKKENRQLKTTLAKQTQELAALNTQFDGLEQQVAAQQLGNHVLTEDDKQQIKKQITQVIGEIDKLLLSLHE